MIPPPPAGGAHLQRAAYVYLLQSRRDGTFYVGWTTNVGRRLVEHNDKRMLNRAASGRLEEVGG